MLIGSGCTTVHCRSLYIHRRAFSSTVGSNKIALFSKFESVVCTSRSPMKSGQVREKTQRIPAHSHLIKQQLILKFRFLVWSPFLYRGSELIPALLVLVPSKIKAHFDDF